MAQSTDPMERPGAQQWVPDGADVEQLREAAPSCRGCELWQGASQVVFSAGNPNARVALVGEQPGDEEDRRGLPFVGPAGRLLQKAVDAAGIDRAQTYVTNSVKHFRFRQDGPGKRRIHQTPDLAHLEACKPWLAAELRAVDPELVICLGATAVRQLLGTQVKVMRDRGTLVERETSLGPRTFLVTVHPSSVLRSDDRDAAYAALVADLRVGAALLTAE
ncbi:MAG: UdgX family uracil-DNA binding protein [Motilibacteraceae bacterium]